VQVIEDDWGAELKGEGEEAKNVARKGRRKGGGREAAVSK